MDRRLVAEEIARREKANRELVRFRVANIFRSVTEIRGSVQLEKEFQGEEERFKVREELAKTFCAFVTFLAIQKWRSFYEVSRWGVDSRLKFLALVGDSRKA